MSVSEHAPPVHPDGRGSSTHSDPALAAFAELVASRRARDVKRTLAAQRRLRDAGYLVSLLKPGGRRS